MAPLSNLTEFVSDFYAIDRHIQFNTIHGLRFTFLTTLSKGQTSTCKSKEQRMDQKQIVFFLTNIRLPVVHSTEHHPDLFPEHNSDFFPEK